MTPLTAATSTLTLAQQAGIGRLPPGPALERWIFESPIPTAALLVGLGLVALFVLQRAKKPRVGMTALGLSLVLGASVYIAGETTVTPREAVRTNTQSFIDAMAAGDPQAARALLGEGFTMVASGQLYDRLSAGELADLAPTIDAAIESHRIRNLSASSEGTNVARTRFDLTVSADGTPFPSGWEFSWRRVGEGWQVIRIECLHLWNRAPGRLFDEGVRSLR